jgi:hypothetical protein
LALLLVEERQAAIKNAWTVYHQNSRVVRSKTIAE